jgi:hypothetical protein
MNIKRSYWKQGPLLAAGLVDRAGRPWMGMPLDEALCKIWRIDNPHYETMRGKNGYS